MNARSRRSHQRAFTLVELLVVIAIIGILVALLLPAVQAAREAARRAQCQSNIKNVALAVLNYETAHKTLPMGTVFPVVPIPNIPTNFEFRESWATAILPYIESQSLYDAIDFTVPMRHANNYETRGTAIPVLLCPSDHNNQVKYEGPAAHGDNWARGNYAANVGNGALHSSPSHPNVNGGAGSIVGPDSPGWNGIRPTGARFPGEMHHLFRGVMGPNVALSFRQITDGTSKTMMLGEIRAGIHEGDPRGSWAFGHAGGNLLAYHGWGGDDNGPNYCGALADDIGGTGKLQCATDPQLQAECMPCSGGGPSNSFDQATVRSLHTGGVLIALCDGSVQFISDDIETSGPWGACCKPWDHLVLSKDGGDPGSSGRPGRP